MNPGKSSNVTPLKPRTKCPECGKLSTRADYPFCSPRCKDVDLNRWLSGRYVIPGEPADNVTSEDDG